MYMKMVVMNDEDDNVNDCGNIDEDDDGSGDFNDIVIII